MLPDLAQHRQFQAQAQVQLAPRAQFGSGRGLAGPLAASEPAADRVVGHDPNISPAMPKVGAAAILGAEVSLAGQVRAVLRQRVHLQVVVRHRVGRVHLDPPPAPGGGQSADQAQWPRDSRPSSAGRAVSDSRAMPAVTGREKDRGMPLTANTSFGSARVMQPRSWFQARSIRQSAARRRVSSTRAWIRAERPW